MSFAHCTSPSRVHSTVYCTLSSGKKKQHKRKFFGPNFLRTLPTLTPGCLGVKEFLPITGAAGKPNFRRGRPRFSARTSMTRRVLEKLCTEKVCVDFLAPTKVVFHCTGCHPCILYRYIYIYCYAERLLKCSGHSSTQARASEALTSSPWSLAYEIPLFGRGSERV